MNIRIALFCLLFSTSLSSHAALVHRYSFNDPAGSTTVKDSAGTANGTLQGGASLDGSGQVTLDGSDGYVDLPNGTISALTNATFEAWVTFQSGGGAWQRVFDFGNNSNGEDAQGTGLTYIFLTPTVGTSGFIRFAGTTNSNGSENPSLNGPLTPTDQQAFLAVTYDYTDNRARLYLDGQLIASGLAPFPLTSLVDINNWLGRSNWPDAYFLGSFNEFRIFDSELSPLQIALDAGAGPDQLGTSNPGPVQSIALTIDSSIIKGDTAQASVAAFFTTLTNIDVSAEATTVYSSAATNILTVTSNGLVKAINVGSSTITATYGGKSDTKVITVLPLPSLAPVLKHRYSFNEDASKTVAADSVGTANGNLVGGAVFSGDGKVVLDGTDGYVDLPNGTISILTNATFEVWTTWSGSSAWQRIFDFGSNSAGENKQGTGQTYLFLTPRSGNNTTRFAITQSSNGGESPILDAPTALQNDVEMHLAVVYDVTEKIAKLYINGALIAQRAASIPLKNIKDVNNWLGRSNWPDPFYNGTINEFRIYEGVLSDQQIAFSIAAGPDKLATDPGTLQALRLDVPASILLGGYPTNAIIRADYQTLTNVNVNAFPGAALSSSNPNIVSVAPSGALEGVGIGTATVSGNYLGKQVSAQVTVTIPDNAITNHTLLHRYSFNDAVGSTTVKDSVGGADGTLNDTGTFDGAQLTLNGSNGYVDLPNGLISSLFDVTFEGWVTENSARNWERIFDFGNNSGGEGNQGNGQTYVFFTPRNSVTAVARFAFNGGTGENPDLNAAAAFTRTKETHFAISYSYLSAVARLYINGKRVAIAPAPSPLSNINDENVWLGRSQFMADPYFLGSYNEFRIWNGALLDPEVAASYAAGPDILSTPGGNPSGGGSTSISVSSSGAQITLSWPAGQGYILQSTPVLGGSANWQAVSGTPADQNGTTSLSVTPSGSATFFRLKK